MCSLPFYVVGSEQSQRERTGGQRRGRVSVYGSFCWPSFLFYVAIFARVPGFDNKPTCTQWWFNEWTKWSVAGQQHGKLTITELQRAALVELRMFFFSYSYKHLQEIWSIRGFWCNADFMTRCLPFCKRENYLLIATRWTTTHVSLTVRQCTTKLSTMLTKTRFPTKPAATDICLV